MYKIKESIFEASTVNERDKCTVSVRTKWNGFKKEFETEEEAESYYKSCLEKETIVHAYFFRKDGSSRMWQNPLYYKTTKQLEAEEREEREERAKRGEAEDFYRAFH